ncbi:unnamed protein product, partial [Brachionus calyciflorus]
FSITRSFPTQILVENVPNIPYIKFILKDKIDHLRSTQADCSLSKVKDICIKNPYSNSKTTTCLISFEDISHTRTAALLVNSIVIGQHQLIATPMENTRVSIKINEFSKYEKLSLYSWLYRNLNRKYTQDE